MENHDIHSNLIFWNSFLIPTSLFFCPVSLSLSKQVLPSCLVSHLCHVTYVNNNNQHLLHNSMSSTLTPFFTQHLLPKQVRNNTWTLTNITKFHHKNHVHFSYLAPKCSTLKNPKGFGPTPKKRKKNKTKDLKKEYREDGDKREVVEEEEDERYQDVIPEVVTNRMMRRVGFSVGIPLGIGLLFFPFFYYLKVGLKIDVPTWVPFIVSFFFFGSALLGVSYGIVSSSWDPLREGSLLGWNEAQKNWPVFWQSFRGGGSRKD